MSYLILLLFVTSVAACPEPCKCTGGTVKCKVPEEKSFPLLKWTVNMTVLDLSGKLLMKKPMQFKFIRKDALKILQH